MTEFSSNFPTTCSEAVIFVSSHTPTKGHLYPGAIRHGCMQSSPGRGPQRWCFVLYPLTFLEHSGASLPLSGQEVLINLVWLGAPALAYWPDRDQGQPTQPPSSVIPPFPVEALSCFPPIEQRRAACDLAVLGTTPSPGRAINMSQQAASSGLLSFASARLSKHSLGPGCTCWPMVTAEAWSHHRATVAGTPPLTS